MDEASLRATPLTLTHRSLLDNTVEGAECAAERVFCAQFHPEGASGFFDRFIEAMRTFQAGR